VLAVVVWSWDVSTVHRVLTAYTTTASTARQTPHAVLKILVLLTMGINDGRNMLKVIERINISLL
jgi:hypothetical protein